MIVRINQLDIGTAEQNARWDADSLQGSIDRAWPDGTSAYQLLILDHDEQRQAIAAASRREQIRQMLPKLIDALAVSEDRVVIRLDGPFNRDGLAPAFAFAADPDRCDRYSYSAADQFADRAEPPITSIRIFPHPHRLSDLCTDLRPSVRLRAFGVPGELVDPLLDTADLDDERWSELLAGMGFMVSTSSDLLSLLIWTSRFEADEIRQRITEYLGGRESAGMLSA